MNPVLQIFLYSCGVTAVFFVCCFGSAIFGKYIKPVLPWVAYVVGVLLIAAVVLGGVLHLFSNIYHVIGLAIIILICVLVERSERHRSRKATGEDVRENLARDYYAGQGKSLGD